MIEKGDKADVPSLWKAMVNVEIEPPLVATSKTNYAENSIKVAGREEKVMSLLGKIDVPKA